MRESDAERDAERSPHGAAERPSCGDLETISGVITLSYADAPDCGPNGVFDIRPGGDVTVRDRGGTIVGRGRLDGIPRGCRYTFAVDGLPDIAAYRITVEGLPGDHLSTRQQLERNDWEVEFGLVVQPVA